MENESWFRFKWCLEVYEKKIMMINIRELLNNNVEGVYLNF